MSHGPASRGAVSQAPGSPGPASQAPASQAPARADSPSGHGPAFVASPFVPGQETRIRVSVKLSVRDPNLVLARPLREGEAAPPGTREAFLVLTEAGVPDEAKGPSDGNGP